MGDRSGLTKLDRTNGYDDGRDYMRVKKSKLAQQNDQIREALRSRNKTQKTDIFKNISICVNGRTQPTADELKRMILLNGGDYHPYYRYQSTKFMIATNLSMARMKTLRPDDRVVRPEWITESIDAKCLLPYEDYQIFAEEPRGKNGSVLAIESGNPSTSRQELVSVTDSYSRNYRKQSKQRGDDKSLTKSRDIREMFSKTIRNLHSNQSGSQKERSNASSDAGNSRDKDSSPEIVHDDSSNSRTLMNYPPTTSSNQINNGNGSGMISNFVTKSKSSKPSTSAPIIPIKQRDVPNIRGYSSIDDIIRILSEWVGRPGCITDEQTTCVTKYFFDLIGERNYQNKFYEIMDAFQHRVIQQDEPSWILFYNNLVKTVRDELNKELEATQNLCHLISSIETPDGGTDDSSIEETNNNSHSKTNNNNSNNAFEELPSDWVEDGVSDNILD